MFLDDLIAEAELLSIATEIFTKLNNFNHKNCTIRLNHISLVQGILMYSGIEKARHLEFCNYFAKLKVNNIYFIPLVLKHSYDFIRTTCSKAILPKNEL